MIWYSRRHASVPVPQSSCTPIAANAMHPSEDDLERYAMGVLRDQYELASLEEHLLACPTCVARTEALEDYVWKIRPSLRQSLIDVIEFDQ